MEIFDCKTYPYDELLSLKAARRGPGRSRHSARWYADVIATFDIEATNVRKIQQAIMYHWQCCIGGRVVVGRTWEEFAELLDQIDQHLPKGLTFVWYVHNLAYEWQFLRAIHQFDPLPPRSEWHNEVFCVTGRKVVRALIGTRFEFRCSYFMTNMSLREFLKRMGVEHGKTELDYSVQRWPWTQLSPEEMEYCINDVLGLYEAIRIFFDSGGYNLATVCMSSTGFVRQDFKRAMRQDGEGMTMVRRCAPSYQVYLHIRRAFRGGNTHCSRLYVDTELENVKSFDRSSSYPDVLVNMLYPVEPFYRDLNVKHIADLWDRTPYLLCVKFENIRLKDPYNGCPYLSIHKCQTLLGCIDDNGRVCRADQLETYLTDIDTKIVAEMYEWDSDRVVSCYRSEYGRLPQGYITTVMEYYRQKTKLKTAPKDVEETEEDKKSRELAYLRAKQRLNSCFGMAATNPCRTNLIFNGIDFSPADDMTEQEALAKANRNAFTLYAWGCWCTAWARFWLQRAIDICGTNFVYCDTDSVKYLGDVDLSELNDEIREISQRHEAYADDPAGVRHYLGVYEEDSEPGGYKKFKSMGAKKYAYVDSKGLHITIAGVSKSGAEEMEDIKNFREGFIFRKAGGTEAVYNDDPHGVFGIDGHTIKLTPNIYLEESQYKLGMTMDYKWIIRLSPEEFDKYLKTR